MRTEAFFLKTEGPATEDDLGAAARCARDAGLAGTVRRAENTPWIELRRAEGDEPLPPAQSPEWFAALLNRDVLRWEALVAAARALSQSWPHDVVTLEGAAASAWVRYSRWRAGETARCFEYAANDIANAGWVKNDGEPESWEDDEEVGPDLGSLAHALGVPGLEAQGGPPCRWQNEAQVD